MKNVSRDIVVVPQDESQWEDAPRDEVHKTSTLLPWGTYDRYLRGECVAEIAIADAAGETLVLADIAQMRDEMRRMCPGLTDSEADALRFEDILIRQSMIIGDPQSLKIAADAHIRRRKIQEVAIDRHMYRGY